MSRVTLAIIAFFGTASFSTGKYNKSGVTKQTAA